MEKKVVRRYQCVISKNGKSEILKFEVDGVNVDRFTLKQIDSLTMKTSDKNEFIELLNDSGFNFDLDSDIFVQYKSDGTIKKLDPVFGNMNMLCKILDDDLNQSQSKINFHRFLDIFYLDINNSEFLKFIENEPYNRYISKKLKYAINNYLACINESLNHVDVNAVLDAKCEINKALDYKTVRGFLIGKKHYELKLKGEAIPSNPNILTYAQRQFLNLKLNHPEFFEDKKIEDEKKDDGQMSLFDVSEYTTSESKGLKKYFF